MSADNPLIQFSVWADDETDRTEPVWLNEAHIQRVQGYSHGSVVWLTSGNIIHLAEKPERVATAIGYRLGTEEYGRSR